MKDRTVFVSVRQMDMPKSAVASGLRQCGRCDNSIWVDVSLLDQADQCDEYSCIQCLDKDELKQAAVKTSKFIEDVRKK